MDGYETNFCSYDNCGKKFDNIRNLVLHIEAFHIDFQTTYDDVNLNDSDDEPMRGIPMSRVLQYGTDYEIAATRVATTVQNGAKKVKTENIFDLQKVPASVDVSLFLEKVKWEDVPAEVPTSPPSPPHPKRHRKACWFGPEEMSPLCKTPTAAASAAAAETLKTIKQKKYACPVPGCTKSYKNLNGMKYHVVNFHDMHGSTVKQAKVKKEFKCDFCTKEYKTFRGLQGHIQAHQQQSLAPTPRPSPRPRRQAATPKMREQQAESRYYYQQAQHTHQPGSGAYEEAEHSYAEHYRRVRLLKQIYGDAFDPAYYIDALPIPRSTPIPHPMPAPAPSHSYHSEAHTHTVPQSITATSSASTARMYERYEQVGSRSVASNAGLSNWTYEHAQHLEQHGRNVMNNGGGRQYGGQDRDTTDYATMSMQLEELQKRMLQQQITCSRARTRNHTVDLDDTDSDDGDIAEVHRKTPFLPTSNASNP